MKEFTMNIEMGNEAMNDAEALATALEDIARRIRDGADYGRVKDLNGNFVGDWEIS